MQRGKCFKPLHMYKFNSIFKKYIINVFITCFEHLKTFWTNFSPTFDFKMLIKFNL